jgi:hypothetical protein
MHNVSKQSSPSKANIYVTLEFLSFNKIITAAQLIEALRYKPEGREFDPR